MRILSVAAPTGTRLADDEDGIPTVVKPLSAAALPGQAELEAIVRTVALRALRAFAELGALAQREGLLEALPVIVAAIALLSAVAAGFLGARLFVDS